jgi:glycosyltransferase involved in cell wall biosynthesis
MVNGNEKVVYFLCWGCPWPGTSGGALRTQGLITEIAKGFKVKLIVFTDNLGEDRRGTRSVNVEHVRIIPMRSRGLINNAKLAVRMLTTRIPYHYGISEISLRGEGLELEALNSQAVFYSAGGNFACISPRNDYQNRKWIIDQFDVPTQYWLLRSKEYYNPAKKLIARINYRLVKSFYAEIYEKVGCVISVCEEDKELSEQLAPRANIQVIENGVDTVYFRPSGIKLGNKLISSSKKMLFTGTSNEKNIRALSYFLMKIMPKIKEKVPGAELIVAGDFSEKAIRYLKRKGEATFTRKVADIRPFYESCDVFINPFKEAYGSKLKIPQALSMGICIVTTKEGGRGFKLVDGENAFVAGDDQEFIDKAIEALRDSDIRNKVAKNGRQYAEEHLDWCILGKKIRAIIDSI